MKLSLIAEAGHWLPLANYPNSLVRGKGSNVLSPLLHPDDRSKAGVVKGGEFTKRHRRKALGEKQTGRGR